MTDPATPDTVLAFWFDEVTPQQRWQKDAAFDQLIRDRFASVHAEAAGAELFAWRSTPAGRLAEIIVLDQFSRNMFRDQAGAFAHDPLSLALAQEAVAVGAHLALDQGKRNFLLMPFMHSESWRIHEAAASLFAAFGDENTQDFERRHREIIERFGRYPHRNDILGRASTQEEQDFLKQPGSGF